MRGKSCTANGIQEKIVDSMPAFLMDTQSTSACHYRISNHIHVYYVSDNSTIHRVSLANTLLLLAIMHVVRLCTENWSGILAQCHSSYVSILCFIKQMQPCYVAHHQIRTVLSANHVPIVVYISQTEQFTPGLGLGQHFDMTHRFQQL